MLYSIICIPGDQRFEDAALKALDGLWKAKSNIGLVIATFILHSFYPSSEDKIFFSLHKFGQE